MDQLYEPSELRSDDITRFDSDPGESCDADPRFQPEGRRYRLRVKRPHPYLYMDRTARCFAVQRPHAMTQEKTHMHSTDPLDPRPYDDEYDLQNDPQAQQSVLQAPLPQQGPTIARDEAGMQGENARKRSWAAAELFDGDEDEDGYIETISSDEDGDEGFPQDRRHRQRRVRFDDWENYFVECDTVHFLSHADIDAEAPSYCLLQRLE